jgi:hypothetical protein
MTSKSPSIGELGERSLHAALKQWYAQPGDLLEAPLHGCVIDIARPDLWIEIQTRHFGAIRLKLQRLVEHGPVRLVYPIAVERWIVREGLGPSGRRRSPRRGRLEHLFLELVRLADLPSHPNFSLEVLLIRDEEHRLHDGKGSWRRKGWSISDRLLLEVTGRHLFSSPQDYRALLPSELVSPFTSRDLAKAARMPLYLAQKMVYCLRRMALVSPNGKRGRYTLYEEL